MASKIFEGGLSFNKKPAPEFEENFNNYAILDSYKDPDAPGKDGCPWRIENGRLVITRASSGNEWEWLAYISRAFFREKGLEVSGMLFSRREDEESFGPSFVIKCSKLLSKDLPDGAKDLVAFSNILDRYCVIGYKSFEMAG